MRSKRPLHVNGLFRALHAADDTHRWILRCGGLAKSSLRAGMLWEWSGRGQRRGVRVMHHAGGP